MHFNFDSFLFIFTNFPCLFILNEYKAGPHRCAGPCMFFLSQPAIRFTRGERAAVRAQPSFAPIRAASSCAERTFPALS